MSAGPPVPDSAAWPSITGAGVALPRSVWDHPCDDYYKNMYKEEKDKLAKKKTADAEKAKKEKEEKKERKRKKKEAKAAAAAAEAAAAAAQSQGGGLPGGAAPAAVGGLGPVSMGPGGGLAPVKTLNKSAPLKMKTPEQRAQEEAEARAIQEKYDTLRAELTEELSSDLSALEARETEKKEGEFKRELSALQGELNERKQREQATKSALEQEVATLKQKFAQKQASAAAEAQAQAKEAGEQALQTQLDMLRKVRRRPLDLPPTGVCGA